MRWLAPVGLTAWGEGEIKGAAVSAEPSACPSRYHMSICICGVARLYRSLWFRLTMKDEDYVSP